MKKVISIILLLVIVLTTMTQISYATTLSGMMSQSDDFIKAANSEKIEEAKLQDLSGTIYNILLVIAIIASVIVGIVLGVQFILASGAEGKADVKQAMLPYFVGMVVVFGSFGIWKVVVLILNSTQ